VSEKGRSARSGRIRSLALALGLAAASAGGYESDQYSNRLEPIADSAPELDRVVNEALEQTAREWPGGGDRREFAYQIYRRLGGMHWVDRIERFAMRSDEIEKLPQFRWRSIFRGAPFWATRVNFLFGVGATIRIGDSLVGTDKLGHFISQGLKYYRSRLAGWSEERIVGRGRFNERWLFGQLTTSVYSNADLVANYEGYRFYRSLFESGILGDQPPIIRLRRDGAEVLRSFRWGDHVNDFWDEALNPSFMSPALSRYLHRRLPDLCGDYRLDPVAFVPKNEEELRRRYSSIRMRDAVEFRLDRICAESGSATSADRGPSGVGD
jgi:hypothetical protein